MYTHIYIYIFMSIHIHHQPPFKHHIFLRSILLYINMYTYIYIYLHVYIAEYHDLPRPWHFLAINGYVYIYIYLSSIHRISHGLALSPGRWPLARCLRPSTPPPTWTPERWTTPRRQIAFWNVQRMGWTLMNIEKIQILSPCSMGKNPTMFSHFPSLCQFTRR